MEKTIFQHLDYKIYLNAWLASQPGGGHGLRGKMAQELGCKTAFISQVLNGPTHLSLESAEKLNRFLGHGKDESVYFVLLVQHARAGSEGLRKLVHSQMQTLIDKQRVLRERVSPTREISEPDQFVYLSSWLYAAVHGYVTTPPFQTKASIAEALRVSISEVSIVLDFLVSRGLVEQKGDHYSMGSFHIHFPALSPMIARHHLNWRLQAIQSLEFGKPENTHYSSVINISRADVPKVSTLLADSLAAISKVVAPSKEEVLYSVCFDLFQVGRK